MCQEVTMKKRSRSATSLETVTKRAKQIALDSDIAPPASPADVASDLDEAGAASESSVDVDYADPEDHEQIVSQDLNLEVKLMQGAVNDMQATVNLASVRISELRDLLKQYAESR